MATPDFVLELRRHIGSAPLRLVGVTAVVFKDEKVLLGRRADNGTSSASRASSTPASSRPMPPCASASRRRGWTSA